MKKGFTILELVVVMVIIGILAGAMYTAWPGKKVNANLFSAQLASDLRYVQMLSISRNNPYELKFDTGNNQYQLFRINNGSNEVAEDHPFTNSNTVTYDSDIAVTLTNLPNDSVTYNNKGVPYTDIGLGDDDKLSSTAQIQISSDSKSYYVCLSPYTGMVEIKQAACS